MNIRNRFKRWFKLRFAVFYPLGIFAVLFGHSDDNSIMAGIWFIIAGLLIRMWANGYAIKLDKLTTCGPYAFVRHPLYLGTTLLIVGFVVMLKIYYVGTLFFLVMIAVYYRTIKKEEVMLEEKFKHCYLDYKRRVPAIIPSLIPYRKGEKWSFNAKRLIRSQEYKLFLWMIIITIAFHLKDEFMIEHEMFDAKTAGLIIVAFILGIFDLVGEFIKHRNRKQSI